MTSPDSDVLRDAGAAVVKTMVPFTIWTLTLNDWLALFGIGYILLQGAYLVWKWRREGRHAWRSRQAARPADQA